MVDVCAMLTSPLVCTNAQEKNFLYVPVRKSPLRSALSAISFLHLAASARFWSSPAFPAAQLPFPKSPLPAPPPLPKPNPLPPTLTEIGGSGAHDAPPTIHVVRHFPRPRVPCDDHDALAHLLRLHGATPSLAVAPGIGGAGSQQFYLGHNGRSSWHPRGEQQPADPHGVAATTTSTRSLKRSSGSN